MHDLSTHTLFNISIVEVSIYIIESPAQTLKLFTENIIDYTYGIFIRYLF
jgi:hypothetical protein